MNTKNLDWKDIPDEYLSEWRAVFDTSHEGINLSQPCPVCGNKQLHRYYQISQKQESVINARKYIARGSLWEWCSSCHCYLHASAAVPEWWLPPKLEIDESQLTHPPDILEKAVRAKSNHV